MRTHIQGKNRKKKNFVHIIVEKKAASIAAAASVNKLNKKNAYTQ
jgi:hypothetical protein